MRDNPGPPLFVVVPTGSPSKQTLAPASSIAGLAVGPLTAIYVEAPAPLGRGNDATAERGNAALPCATLDKAIALAVAALPAPSSFVLGPGTYAPPSAPIPDALEYGVLTVGEGANASNVIIDARGTGRPCWDLSIALAGGKRSVWTVGISAGGVPTMRFQQDAGSTAFLADGTNANAGDFFQNGALSFGCVLEGGKMTTKYVGTLILANLQSFGSDLWLFSQGGQVICEGEALIVGGNACEVFYDAADPKVPAGGPPFGGAISFTGKWLWPAGSITLREQASINVSPGNVLPDLFTSEISIGPAPGFARTSIVAFGGAVFNSVQADMSLNLGGFPRCELRGCELLAPSLIRGLGAGLRIAPNLDGAIVRQTIEFAHGMDGSCRGATFDLGAQLGIVTSFDGTVIPPDGVAMGPVNALPGTTPLALPWRIGGKPFLVVPVSDNPGTGAIAVNNYTATSVDLVPAVAVGNLGGILSMR